MFSDHFTENIYEDLYDNDKWQFLLLDDLFEERDNSLDLGLNINLSKKPTISTEKRESTNSNMDFYDINSIKDILKKYIKDENIINKLNEENTLENSFLYNFIFTHKKLKIKTQIETSYSTNRAIKIKPHNKMTPDNIHKKIKSYLLNGEILNFLNILLNLEGNDYSKKLVKINYDLYINQLQRKKELNHLRMKVKDLLSLNITTKYKNLKPTHNKLILENINKTPTINFVLNLTYIEFIELYTHKKKIEEIKLNEIRDNEIIKKNLPGVEKFFIDLLEDNNYDIEYSLLVIFYLFNLERICPNFSKLFSIWKYCNFYIVLFII